MKKERPSFSDFLVGQCSASQRKVYTNTKTGKIYIEKNAFRNKKIFIYITVCLSPTVLLLVRLLRLIADVSNSLYYNIDQVITLVIVFVVVFIAYPLRFFVVAFEEIKHRSECKNRKHKIGDYILVVDYFIIGLLISYISVFVIR